MSQYQAPRRGEQCYDGVSGLPATSDTCCWLLASPQLERWSEKPLKHKRVPPHSLLGSCPVPFMAIVQCRRNDAQSKP